MVINKKSEHVEDIIRAMDYTYSDEGIEFFQLGVEGETFTRDPKTPSGYKLDKTQSVWTVGPDGVVPDGLKKGTDYGYGTWWLTGVITPIQRFGTTGFKEGEDEQAKVVPNRIQKLTELNALRAPDPYLNWSIDENSEIAEITTPLKTYMSENLSKFILGQKPMEEWDAYTEGFKNLGYEKLVKMYNDKLAASK
jgi:putative aldouronate transport system substrate-binding protein